MSKRKIVISEHDNIAALMEGDRAVEFIIHRGDMLLGDVYLATVENILPSIDAAFLNVGGDKMGFLHSSDVPGKGDLKDRLSPKQQLVVQIMKEPTGHKGPRVSTNISLPGRFLVMMPESKGISISRKIMESAERSRLKSVVSLIKPPGVGVIIRTEAANQKESDITEDFETLLERWQHIVSMADTATPPTLLYRDQDLLYRVIREAVTEDVTEIVVDSAFGHQRAQQLLQNWNMDKGVKVTHFQGSQPILVGTGVDKEIKLALQTKVPLPSGGYLYIQPTEALSVVDVNSGKFTSLQSQAETIKLTNLEACKEIARQLRLRNIGGMIVVDFIDMESRANQLQVLQTFENELLPDKAKPQIGQLSDLGLVEMTRHRQGQSLSEIFTRRCHTCTGTGHAIEEFSWMHNGGEGEGRGRQSGGRNNNPKLPTRNNNNRMQQVPKPAASVHQRRDKGRVLLNNLDKQNGEAQGKDPLNKDKAENKPGNILLNSLAEQRTVQGGQNQPTETESLLETIADKLQKQYGLKFAMAAKFSFMPIAVNNILSRIHPKANDIVTLVHSIEEGVSLPDHSHHRDDNDRDDGDENGDDSDDANPDAEASELQDENSDENGWDDENDRPDGEERSQRPPHHQNRHHHRNKHPHRGQPRPPREGQNPESDEDGSGIEFHDVTQTAVATLPMPSESSAPQASAQPVVQDAPQDEDKPKRAPRAPRRPQAEIQNDADDSPEEEHAEAPTTASQPVVVQTEQSDSRQSREDAENASPKAHPVSRPSVEPFDDDASEDNDDDADMDSDDDGDDTPSGGGANAGGVANKRRRGGRPAKRSIKKPPAKRS